MLTPRRPARIRDPRGLAATALLILCATLGSRAPAQSPADQPAAQRCPAPSSVVTAATRPPPNEAVNPGVAEQSSEIEIQADDAALGRDGNAELSGNVTVRQGDRQLSAEQVTYDAASQRFRVDGNVAYRDPVLRARGARGEYGQNSGARFEGAEFELPARPARGTAREMSLDTNGVVTLEDVTFSTCPAEDPAWQIRARSIELDTQQRLGTARGAEINFKGVPILYLPYLSFPLGSERKTGFLFPSIGHSTRSGGQLSVPWYWNLRPNLDLTLEPTFYTRRGLDLGGEVRWLTPRQRSLLTFNVLPGDDAVSSGDDDRTRVRLQHRIDLPRGWRARFDAEDVSDSEYFEDFAQGPEGTSVAFLERLAELSYRDENWRLTGQFQQYQTIDRDLPDDERPYARTPRLLASGRWNFGPLGRLSFGFDGELVNFQRDVGVRGWRVDAAPRAGLDFSGAGYFLRPSAGFRYTQYDLDETAPGDETSPNRSMPFAAIDGGLFFERMAGSRGQRRVTLEPRLLYLYTPFRDQTELPVFDTAVPDFSFVQLFRTNRYVGADRVSDANQVSVGVTSRLFRSATQQQFLAATLGQTYYFDQPRVSLPGEAPRTTPRSDLVAQLSLNAYQDWSLDLGMQWDPEQSRSERAQVRMQYRPAADRVVNLAYRLQRNRLEQAEVSGAWPIGDRWNAFARVVYDLQDNSALERFAGFEYKACCWRLRAVARRFVSSRTGEKDTGIYLQLELNGLASVGVPADAFLERAIRGYSGPQISP